MLICFNIANSDISIGVFDGDSLISSRRISALVGKTADEYALTVSALLSMDGITVRDITGAAVSSVVPALTPVISDMCLSLFGKRPLTVGPGVKNGLNIKTDNPAQLGADLVCAAVAVSGLYRLPAVIVCLDTATSFIAVDEKKVFLGCAIAPGVLVSADALVKNGALLSGVDFSSPVGGIIGTNTVSSIQSGVIYGFASMIDGMCGKMASVFDKKPAVIVTGDRAENIVGCCQTKMTVDSQLILKGLKMIYERNL